MRRKVASLLVGVLAAGCGSSPPGPPTTVPAPVVVAVPPPAASASEPEPPQVLVPEPLASPACVFGEAEGELRSSLGFVAGGERFATIAGKVRLERLEIAAGNERAYAIVDDGRVRLAAEVAPQTVRLGPRDPTPIDGWLEVKEGRLAQVTPGRVRLEVSLPKQFTPSGVTPVRVELACDQLTPIAGESDETGAYVRVVPGRRVPVSVAPGGAVVGHLFRERPKPAAVGALAGVAGFSLDMRKIAERGRHARVRLTGWGARVVGWIPGDAIDAQSVGVLGVLSGLGDPGGPKVTCDEDVALIVTADGTRHRVGSLHAGAAVPVVAKDERPIALRLSGSPLDDFSVTTSGEPLHPKRPVIAPDQAARCRIE